MAVLPRDLDVLLLQPGDGRDWGPNPLLESLGLGYLAAVLRRLGARVEIVDACLEELSGERLLERLLQERYPLLGVSLSFQYPSMGPLFDLLRALRERRPELLIVAGGRFASFAWSEILDTDAVDAVAVGEGEVAIAELHRAVATGSDLAGVSSLVFRRENALVHTPRAPLVDLDTLPFPERPYLERIHAASPASVRRSWHNLSRSRGCFGVCAYCVINAFGRLGRGAIWRVRSAASVVAELSWLKERYGVRRVRFADDEFVGPGQAGREAAVELAETLAGADLGMEFALSLRVDNMWPDVLVALQRAGLRFVLVGIEAGNQADLDLYGKGTSPEQNVRALRMATDLGLQVVPSLIPFHPWSTLPRVAATLDFLIRQHGPQVNLEPLALFNRLSPLAGSAIANRFCAERLPVCHHLEHTGPVAYPFLDPAVARYFAACEQHLRRLAADAETALRAADVELQRLREEIPASGYALRETLYAAARCDMQGSVLKAARRLAAEDEPAAAGPAIARDLAGQLAPGYRTLKLLTHLPARWPEPRSEATV